MEENITLGDFGTIVFYVISRIYSTDAEGKLRYKTTKTPFTIEGAEITDASKSRVRVQGIDKDIPESFDVRRCNIKYFERQERPVNTKKQ